MDDDLLPLLRRAAKPGHQSGESLEKRQFTQQLISALEAAQQAAETQGADQGGLAAAAYEQLQFDFPVGWPATCRCCLCMLAVRFTIPQQSTTEGAASPSRAGLRQPPLPPPAAPRSWYLRRGWERWPRPTALAAHTR